MKLRSIYPRWLAATAAAVAAISATPVLAASGHHRARVGAPAASLSISKLTVSGVAVTVRGRVRLTRDTRAVRRRTRVVIAVKDGSLSENHTVALARGLAFSEAWATRLSGRVAVTVWATIGGRASGRPVRRTIEVASQTGPGGGGTGPGGGGTGPGGGAGGGTPLVGLFKLDPGSAPSGQAPSGSYFEMLTGGGGPLANLSSPAPNKNYTPLSPGTQGGFSTAAYQPSPSPAFSAGGSGNALANEIIQPVPFYYINFSIETGATDAQTGASDPLPSIVESGDTLSGQITAWDAQWNGQSFNQGSPKPNGTLPPPTTTLTGTYDPATRRFTLQWKSLIVGGPFNGFTGAWHLTGTFVPAAAG